MIGRLKRVFHAICCFSLIALPLANAKADSDLAWPNNSRKLSLCKQGEKGTLTIIGMPLENPEQIGELRRELKENAVRIPLKAADSGGYLCYVVFEIPEQTECLIARIQITSGLILMLKGRIGEGGIEVNWDRAYGLWQCDKFVAEIFSILKATSPEYLTELNSFYLKITGQSVEERLKEPVKAN